MAREVSSAERWFRRIVKIVLLAVLIAVGISYWPEEIVQVRTEAVAKGSVEQIVPSLQAGEVKPNRQALLRAVTAGRTTALHVKRGDRVEKDQVLLELYGASLQARLRLARANVKSGVSTAATAQVRLKATATALARNKKLAAKGVLSSVVLERFQTEYDIAAGAVATADAQVSQLRAAVDVARVALDETQVKAPFAGLVTQVQVELGEVVAPANPLLELVDDSTILIEAPIDEADLGKLSRGMPVRVETDAYPGRPFKGSLVYISPVVLKDIRQNRSLNVEVGLNGAAEVFRVGMSADIEIVVDRQEEVLFVPTSAILRRGERQQVYVVSGGQARLRTIRTGLANWERTQVLEGVQEGERVVVSLEAIGLGDRVPVTLEGAGQTGRVAY